MLNHVKSHIKILEKQNRKIICNTGNEDDHCLCHGGHIEWAIHADSIVWKNILDDTTLARCWKSQAAATTTSKSLAIHLQSIGK